MGRPLQKRRRVAWSPDGKLLATAEGEGVRLRETGTGRQTRALGRPEQANPQGWLGGVAWEPSGEKVAAYGFGVHIWDAATGGLAADLQLGWVPAIAWSLDGKWLATAGDKAVEVWDTATWKERRSLPEPDAIGLTWSRDGRRLASVGYPGLIQVWDIATGRQLWQRFPLVIPPYRVPGPDGRMISVYETPMDNSISVASTDCIAWNPVRDVLASGGLQTVQICDAANGHQELVLGERRGHVYAVAWSPDGNRLASCREDGTVRVWDLAFDGK